MIDAFSCRQCAGLPFSHQAYINHQRHNMYHGCVKKWKKPSISAMRQTHESTILPRTVLPSCSWGRNLMSQKTLRFSYGNIDVKVMTDDIENFTSLNDFLNSEILISPEVRVNTYDAANILSIILFQAPFTMLDGVRSDYIVKQLAQRQLSGYVKEKLFQHLINN